MRRMTKTKKLAFTIIELIVIIVIIGILAAITITTLSSTLAKSRDSQRNVNVKSVVEALERYYDDNGEYPSCTIMTNSNLNSLSATLKNLDTKALTMPRYTANANAVKCIDIKSTTNDIISYSSDVSIGCQSGTGCLYFSIQYREESTGKIITINSRRTSYGSWKSVATGSFHTCGISISDRLYCWGRNDNGQLGDNTKIDRRSPVPVVKGEMPSLSVKQVTIGQDFTCAIGSNDQAYCWGYGAYGQMATGGFSSDTPKAISLGQMPSLIVKQISAYSLYGCAIASNDNAYCWGNSLSGTPKAIAQGAMPSLIVKQVSVGNNYFCAIGSDDHGYCWGNNYSGKLGNGNTTSSTTPVAVAQGSMSSLSIKQISAAEDHTCAVGLNDQAYCWGTNFYGQLGNNTTTASYSPVAVYQGAMQSLSVKKVFAAGRATYMDSSVMNFTCAIGFDDKTYCWGLNSYGFLGNGNLTRSLVPVKVLKGDRQTETVVSLSSGGLNSCMIADNKKLYCYGYNIFGELGTNTNYSFGSPVASIQGAMPSLTVKNISAGQFHNCAINFNDQVYCWGRNYYGQLGNATKVDSVSPVAVSQGTRPSLLVKQLSTGNNHNCLIATANSQGYCWGIGSNYEIGDGSGSDRTSPVAVSLGAMPSLPLKDVEVGFRHTCAINQNDQVYCWGSNSSGSLGNGNTTASSTPVAVLQGAMSSLSVKQLSTSGSTVCVVGSDDQAYCWGDNYSGQLGNGNTTDSYVPVAVQQGAMPSLLVKYVITTDVSTCAIHQNNQVYCWGDNYSGQLGNGTNTNSLLPVAVQQGAMPSLSVKSISYGDYRFVCAIASDDHPYCWGENSLFQLGNNATTDSNVPVAVSQGAMPSLDVKQISAAKSSSSMSGFGEHTCMIAFDDKIYCFGSNLMSMLGTDTRSALYYSVPRSVYIAR